MSGGEPKAADDAATDEEVPARAAPTDPAPPIAAGTPAAAAPDSASAGATGTDGASQASGGDTVSDAVAKAAEAAAADTPAAGADTTAEIPAVTEADARPGIHVHLYGQTDVGLVREHNEDNFLLVDLSTNVRGLDARLLKHTVGQRGSLFVVCDGMGGAAAGEVASQMAVDTLHDIMTSGAAPQNRDDFARRLVYAVEEAGSRIFSSAKMDRTRRGMGTTSTVAGVVDKILFVGQVGDSRAYALRGGKDFALITKDQSLVNQLIEAGQLTEEEAEAFEHSNIILQALGTAEQVTVDLTFLELKRGDRLMLCSDGLSGLVHGEMIKDVLATVKDPRACCATLIEMARAGGGHDNITVIVADFDGTDLALPDDTSRVAYQQYPLPDSNDPRTSFPPRETGMKSGGPKPGSDVKSDPYARAARSSGEGEGNKLWLWLAVVVGVLVIAAVVYALAGPSSENAPDSSNGDGAADSTGAAATPGVGDAPARPVEVRVTSDVRNGELWVDGARRVALNPSGRTVLELPPGAYALEARTSEGAIAATASLTVVPGAPLELTLSVPAGSADTLGQGPVTIGAPIGAPLTADAGTAEPAADDDDAEPAGGANAASANDADAEGDAGRPRRRPDGGARASRDSVGARPLPGPLPENPFGN